MSSLQEAEGIAKDIHAINVKLKMLEEKREICENS